MIASGIGGIIPDAAGGLAAAYSGLILARHPLDAELQSFFLGVKLCLNKGITRIILIGDCLILIESLGEGKESVLGIHRELEKAHSLVYSMIFSFTTYQERSILIT